MAPFNFFSKVVSSIFLLTIFNVNEGHCFFYPAPAVARPQGHQQPLYDYHEPLNRVGYGYKPSWAEVHLQPLAEETPQYQHGQYQQQIQYQAEQPVEKQPFQTQHDLHQPQYTLPAHTYLQPSEKYQISPPKYHWSAQPSVKYNIPSIPNPLTYRDPQQHVNVLVPLRLFGVQMFPPFLERLIQRVQTYYSIYNPPDTLTVPYSINTPPTFQTSSLLPPDDVIISPEDENNVISPEFPNIENNSVENNEDVTDTVTTQSPGGRSTTETSTADSTTEDTTKAEIVENTTAPPSSDDTVKSDDNKTEDDKSEDTTTAASSSESDNSETSSTTEMMKAEEQSSSTDKEDTTDSLTTESPSS